MRTDPIRFHSFSSVASCSVALVGLLVGVRDFAVAGGRVLASFLPAELVFQHGLYPAGITEEQAVERLVLAAALARPVLRRLALLEVLEVGTFLCLFLDDHFLKNGFGQGFGGHVIILAFSGSIGAPR